MKHLIVSLVLVSLACLPTLGKCNSNGTRQIAEIALVTESGDRLLVMAPSGSFKYLSFTSGRNFWEIKQTVLHLDDKLALSELKLEYGPGYGVGRGGIVNIVIVPLIRKTEGAPGFSLGELKFEFFENGRAVVSVFPSDDEIDPSQVYSVFARRNDN